MGEVYRATDLHLLRDVALKVLPAEVAADTERLERFRLEARALAALDHPAIVTVHSVEEADGVHFLTMSLVEGQSLEDRLLQPGDGGMSVEDFFRAALAMADGLAAAHERGVVHRDLKPANVMITPDGRAVSLDFGLAKIEMLEPAREDDETLLLTRAGVTMGTVPYMSPEQLAGKAVDARSDLFSLGVVFYQMLSGERPFQGPTSATLAASILTSIPRPLDEIRSDLPAGLEPLVARCLEKSPVDRHAHARDLHADLTAVERGEAAAAHAQRVAVDEGTPSVAVLPFTDMSPQKDHEWFCEGMAEELINGLSAVKGLRVAARASAFQVKGEDIRKIGELLGVRSVLDGSVRTAGTRMRVTAQLNNAEDGYQLWSKRYDRDMDDIFAVQDDISADIIMALEIELGAVSPKPARPRHTDNIEAYHLYLKGRHQFFRRTPEAMAQSKVFFEQALAEDPSYALALAGLADLHALNGFYGFTPTLEASNEARDTAARALAIDDRLSETHNTNAFVQGYYFGRWADSEAGARRSIELNETNVVALVWGASILSAAGHFSEAVEWVERARLLDPLSPYVSALAAMTFLLQFRDEEALAHVEPAIAANPDHPVALYFGAAAYVRIGEPTKAIQFLEHAVDIMKRLPLYLGWLGWAYGVAGREDRAQSVLEELEHRSTSEWIPPLALAWINGGLGHHDVAFEHLERSLEQRSPWLMGLSHLPPFDPLRDDARLADLLQRARYPRGPR